MAFFSISRLQAFLVSNKPGTTRQGLAKIDLKFRLDDTSIVKVYAWANHVPVLENLNRTGALYSLFSLKVMPNAEEGGGRSYPFQLLFNEGSRWHLGKVSGSFPSPLNPFFLSSLKFSKKNQIRLAVPSFTQLANIPVAQ